MTDEMMALRGLMEKSPDAVGIRVKCTNPLERLNGEITRRTMRSPKTLHLPA